MTLMSGCCDMMLCRAQAAPDPLSAAALQAGAVEYKGVVAYMSSAGCNNCKMPAKIFNAAFFTRSAVRRPAGAHQEVAPTVCRNQGERSLNTPLCWRDSACAANGNKVHCI